MVMKMKKNNIKYILWDIDRTLLDFEYAEIRAMKICFKNFNIGEFTDEMLKVYKKINDRYWKDLELGKLTKKQVLEDRFKEFFTLYNIDPNLAEKFNEEYQIYIGEFVCFIKNAEETIKALKGKYKQYAATNGTIVAQNRKLSKSGLDKIFDDVFISEKMGYDKPSVKFFETIFEKVGSNNPEEYIIIGDSLTSDMQGRSECRNFNLLV